MFGDDPDPKPSKDWRKDAGLKLPFYRRAWFSALVALTILGAVGALGVFTVVVDPLREKAETYDLAELGKLESASIIYDRNGKELARLYVLNRTPISIKKVPQHLVDALVAQEDSRFFSHNGVDIYGIIRAVWLNFRAGEETQGASTITQQLARQTFGLMERSYKRKILEAFVAQRIEKIHSKAEILEMYLNRIYFGKGFYGIQAACRGYFDKDASEINVEEAATLAGLIKSPNRLSPLNRPDESIKARNYVLERMVVEGTLDEDEARKLKSKPLVTAPQSGDPRLTYIFDTVREEVMDILGEERAAVGGFRIYTSIDKDLQNAAQEAIREHLAEIEKREDWEHETYDQFRMVMSEYRDKMKKSLIHPDTPKPKPEYLQAAALAVDNTDGSVLAMVGGRDFGDSQFNRATDSKTSVGTAFTPFVYAAAFSNRGIYPGTLVEDKPLDNRRVMIGDVVGIVGEWGMEVPNPSWTQKEIPARQALVEGRNSATVRLGEQVGLDAVIETAKAAGIRTEIRDFPANFLGAQEFGLEEMCLAYTCFPTLGHRPEKLHIIQRITDTAGKVVFQIDDRDRQTVEAMDPIAAYQTHTCLTAALREGTGKTAVTKYGLGDFPAAGKTGTHYKFKDLWYIGYTSSVTCGVWVGFDKPRTIYEGAFSNKVALPIWTDIMNTSQKHHPAAQIAPPVEAEAVEICEKSGLRATDFCYEETENDGVKRNLRCTYTEYLRPGFRFEGYCGVHTGEGLPADLAAFRHTTLSSARTGGIMGSNEFSHIQPVRMQGLTILGKDPYNSEQPIPRAQPLNDDGTRVLRALPVDGPGGDVQESLPIKIAPPPKLKIEL